jgi:hypothetical protein
MIAADAAAACFWDSAAMLPDLVSAFSIFWSIFNCASSRARADWSALHP